MMGSKLFTASTEAHIVTLYDSNMEVYKNCIDYYKKKGDYNAKLPEKPTKNNGAPSANNKYHVSKYSSTNKGQQEWGSWSKPGYLTYNENL